MKPEVSVIIPTHSRADILEECLHRLERQTIANAIEVIVINDVEDDKFSALAAKTDWQVSIHFETIAPCQQGVARNYGVQKAQASTVLYLGDDMFLKPDACALHESIHRNRSTPTAVLGSTKWDPEIEITEVMEWLMISGWQFGYPKIESYAGDVLPKAIQHQFAYTGNISVPTEVARRIPFLEEVNLYGWEDIEWGMRLRDSGVQVYYEPRALAYHHHEMTLEDSLRRMEVIGESAVRIKKIAPDFDRLPRGWKKLAYHVFSKFPTMAGQHRAAFLRGIAKAKSNP